jgi:Tol biopolymer transport system component
VIGNQERAEVVKYDATARQFVPFLPGSSVAMLDITSDGGSLTFVSYPDGSLWRSKRDLTGRSQLTSPPLNVMLPRWSPDGRLVAFQARMPEGRWQIYLVPAQGGSPQPILPEMRAGQTDPGWSPDGKQLVFGGPEDEATGLRLVDLRSRQVSTLPASEGLFSPRWSPGGQYIAALRLESHDLMVFNLRTQTWVELAKGPAGWPCWSRDGQHLYVLGSREGGDWIDRVRISDHKAERVVSLAGIQRPSGVVGSWIGLAPDDSLLVLRDLSIREIYAVSLEAP